MDPVTGMIAGQVLSAGLGAWGANQAANAQQEAAKKAADAARRNYLMQIQLNEPNRQVGYQALGDLSSAFGYSVPGYTPASQIANTLNPLGAKAVRQAVKQGMSVDQIAQMGTLGQLNAKSLKRLARAGLSPADIQRLQTGGMSNQAPPASPAAPVGGTGGQMDFSRFISSPDYQFRVNEGQRDIGNSFAARGGAASGNALRALTEFNQAMAGAEFGNWFSRRAQMAGLGTAATRNVANAAQNTTNSLIGSQQAQGDARASGIMGGVNSVTGAINSGINNYLLSKYLSPQQAPQQQSPFGPYAGGYKFPYSTPPYLPPGLGGN